ncbi:uncharacterized protein LOC143475026 [Brachyhypopomus gauderio]|uniref:uncharacterized protein LOC143475026 n=1 Tax=Brachyhypopomus gauderio TaxID=698409 RepID=UPI0040430758
MSDSVSRFQSEVAAVMEVLLKVAVMEITKVFEGRSVLSKDVDGQPDTRVGLGALPDLKACMEGALRNHADKIVCSVGVQAGETPPAGAEAGECLPAPQMEEGPSPAASPYLVETVDLQCTVDFPYTIFKEQVKGEDGDTFALTPTWVSIPQGELSNQENDIQEPSSLLDPLPSFIVETEPHLFSTVTTDVPSADPPLQNLGHSLPDVISVVDEPTKTEPMETAVSAEEQVSSGPAAEKTECTNKNASDSSTPVKRVRFQVGQSPVDSKILRPCSVQLVNLLLVSGSATGETAVGPSGKDFSMPKDLRAHQGPHTGRRLCCFTACGNGVWRLHPGSAPRHTYTCTICSKNFQRRKILRRHLRFHTGEKPYSCPDCGKTFALRKSLRRHERFHSGERPHVCTHCSKSFRLRDNLKAHLRFHTGEKPFKCTLCSKGFRIHKNLEKHSIVHTMPGVSNKKK